MSCSPQCFEGNLPQLIAAEISRLQRTGAISDFEGFGKNPCLSLCWYALTCEANTAANTIFFFARIIICDILTG